MNAPPDLDPVGIERLRRLGGAKFAGEMIRLFLTYVGDKVAEARAAQQDGDLTRVERAVHPIKSSAGNVGAVRVQQLASDTELRAKGGDAGAVAELVGELEAAYQAVKRLLEAEGKRDSPPADPRD